MTIRYAFSKIVSVSVISQKWAWQTKFHSDHLLLPDRSELSLPNHFDEGRTLLTSALKLLTVANFLRYQLSW